MRVIEDTGDKYVVELECRGLTVFERVANWLRSLFCHKRICENENENDER